MISLVEEHTVAAPPEHVWEWFRDLDANYRHWHPEHLTWRTLRGEPLSEGATIFVDEWLGPWRLSGRSHLHSVRPRRGFRYRLAFPASLLRAGGAFTFTPTASGGCTIRQEVHLGYSTPPLRWLVDALLTVLGVVDHLRRHMGEEAAALVEVFDSRQAPR